jgi:hypothetical protein
MQNFWNNHLSGWLHGVIDGLPGLFAGAADWLASGGATVISGLLNGLQSFWNNSLSPWLHGVLDGLPGLFANAKDWLVQAGSDIIDGLRHGAQDLWNNTVGKWFEGLWELIKAALPEHPETILTDAGSQLMQGLWDGFTAKWNEFTAWFQDQINKLPQIPNPFDASGSTPKDIPPAGGGGGRQDPGAQKAYGGIGGGWTWVGEYGRELVKLAPGSMVIPAGASETRARAMGMAYGGVASDWRTWLGSLTRSQRAQIRAWRTQGGLSAANRQQMMSWPDIDAAFRAQRQAERRAMREGGGLRAEDGSLVPASFYNGGNSLRDIYGPRHERARWGPDWRAAHPDVTREEIRQMRDDWRQGITVYGNVHVHPHDADVAGEIARQFQTRNR